MMQRTRPGAATFALMVLLCAIWGFQQITVKIAMAGISPLLQGGLRSTIATLLLLVWAGWRGLPLLQHDGSLRTGLLAGVLFALEFACIFVGLSLTSASRLVVFLYTAPCFTVLGLHLLVAGERLALRHLMGIVTAFASYLIWFWLLTRYLANRLMVFSFLTPLFGVAFGVLLLHESLTPVFALAALLVVAGIALVNAPGHKA